MTSTLSTCASLSESLFILRAMSASIIFCWCPAFAIVAGEYSWYTARLDVLSAPWIAALKLAFTSASLAGERFASDLVGSVTVELPPVKYGVSF